MPARGSWPKSRLSTPATRALLALGPLRAYSLIPLTTTPPSSEAAGTTVPPGHMQKV